MSRQKIFNAEERKGSRKSEYAADGKQFKEIPRSRVQHLHSDGTSSDDESDTYERIKEERSDESIDGDHSDYTDDAENEKGSDEKDNTTKQPSDSKPSQSYIALIAKAILSTKDRKMVLSDIYKYIIENYPFYKTQDKSWRNSIRHNLSLNECFVKAGRSENGKGNYWAVHPSNEEDFAKGDYRRRRTRRKSKRPAHPFGLYSEFFQPYAMMPPMYHQSSKAMPYIWSPENKYGITENKITRLLPQQKKRKSFTIDSILGLDKGKEDKCSEALIERIEPYMDAVKGQNAARRHHSWSTSPYGYPSPSPPYERSAFSPVYSPVGAESCAPYTLFQDYYRRYEGTPYMGYHFRDTINELSRLRKSCS